MNQGTCLQDLPIDLKPEKLPHHVAVIMDGNGRWARDRGLHRIMGHRRGVDALKDLLRCCGDWGIEALTAYAFSSENWGRPLEEVNFLMTLFEGVLRRELQEMVAEDIQIRFAGNLSSLPLSLQTEIKHSMEMTGQNQGIKLTVATNYGGRQEIIQACQAIATQVQKGLLKPEEINEGIFEQYLYTAGISHPDLLIRTSGEMRISNFLLWQIAYSEIYVTKTFWPDFNRLEFHRALYAYQQRERKFGKI